MKWFFRKVSGETISIENMYRWLHHTETIQTNYRLDGAKRTPALISKALQWAPPVFWLSCCRAETPLMSTDSNAAHIGYFFLLAVSGAMSRHNHLDELIPLFRCGQLVARTISNVPQKVSKEVTVLNCYARHLKQILHKLKLCNK